MGGSQVTSDQITEKATERATERAAEQATALNNAQASVLRFSDCDQTALIELIRGLGMRISRVADNNKIPGSFWGDEEAGLIENVLYLRPDTPVHSALHEACHYACMDDKRRASLHTNAGGDADEENAVCYLQILLADALPDMGREKIFKDMDAWGYSFRFGSTQAWFENDAEDARLWLHNKGLLNVAEKLTHLNRVSRF